MTTPERSLNDPVAGLPTFTDEQIRGLVDYMIAAGRSRGRSQGADFSEADFLAGCMTTLFALGRQDKIPAGWVFELMAGRSPLDLPTLDKNISVIYDPEARRDYDRITVYEDRGSAEMHLSWLSDQGHDRAVRLVLPARHDLPDAVQKAMDAEEDE